MSFMLELDGKMVAACPLQRWKWDPTTLHSTIMGPAGPMISGDVDPARRDHIFDLVFHTLKELTDGRSVKKIEIALPPLAPSARSAWHADENPLVRQIGRASCRERVSSPV